MSKKKYLLMAGMLCALPWTASAQQTDPLTGRRRLFNEGRQLFSRQDYAAARQVLEQYVDQGPEARLVEEADYMLACTAYELHQSDAMERLQTFLTDYPASRYVGRVYYLLGSLHFFDKDYRAAIVELLQADLEKLDTDDRDAGTYRLATAYQETADLQNAALWFTILKEVSRTYAPDAVYNLAYIDYTQRKYDAALKGFREAAATDKYRELSPYYIADIYLKNQRYDEARQQAEQFIAAYPGQERMAEMQRVLGEANYGLRRYAEAVAPLEAYAEAVGTAADRKALYALGMSCYHTQVYSKAAQALGAAATVDDIVSQNAYFHMGLAYLQLKERNQARMAFGQAAAKDFDRAVKEEALYNYALCIHETSYSPFAESVTVFERFLNEFPQSAHTEKVNDYLVEVYMNTRSYLAALQSIAKISRPGARILEAKQKLLFRLGTQAFAQAAFENAIDCFSQSLQLGQYNRQTQADAYYWRGESKYRLEQYAAAGADLRRYLELAPARTSQEYGLALYNLGYVAFKQRQYSEAQGWFAKCVAQAENLQERSVLADAYNRLGDCYFYARRFGEASAQYAQASVVYPALGDYSLFQEGFVKGLQRDYAGKIQTLNRLLTDYPTSQYLDDALYEQGRAFVQLEDNTNAISRYSLLTQRFPDSPLSRKAANEIGLLYYQNDQYNEAIAAYKKVISTYPGSEEARLAQRDLRSIYVDLNKVDEYMAFVASVPGGGSFDVSERDSLTYTAAEKVFMRGEVAEARNSFARYLQSFPEGAFSVNAHFYLGQIAYQQQAFDEAAVHLDKVLELPNSKFADEALSMCAEMAFARKDYGVALKYYRQMADRATSPEARLQAATGALRSAHQLGEPEEIIATASAVLAETKLTPELKNEAHYYRSRAFVADDKRGEAVADWKVLAADTRNVYGAEAKYLLAQYYFDAGETEAAEKEVLDYIEVSTPHAYWLARSFVLLSDVYVKMGRSLDAKQYLLSLQQNYQADDDIAGMIETRLKNLK